MWSHFDSNECPGQAVGLRVQLENQISGFIPGRLIDPPAEKTFETAQPGTILQARVMKIDITKYTVELTLKSSDIQVVRRSIYPATLFHIHGLKFMRKRAILLFTDCQHMKLVLTIEY